MTPSALLLHPTTQWRLHTCCSSSSGPPTSRGEVRCSDRSSSSEVGQASSAAWKEARFGGKQCCAPTTPNTATRESPTLTDKMAGVAGAIAAAVSEDDFGVCLVLSDCPHFTAIPRNRTLAHLSPHFASLCDRRGHFWAAGPICSYPRWYALSPALPMARVSSGWSEKSSASRSPEDCLLQRAHAHARHTCLCGLLLPQLKQRVTTG
jgi:hypothetical protein